MAQLGPDVTNQYKDLQDEHNALRTEIQDKETRLQGPLMKIIPIHITPHALS
jgi:hypothetical protein